MNVRRERCSRARLVVVFEKTGQLVLIIQPGMEMLAVFHLDTPCDDFAIESEHE